MRLPINERNCSVCLHKREGRTECLLIFGTREEKPIFLLTQLLWRGKWPGAGALWFLGATTDAAQARRRPLRADFAVRKALRIVSVFFPSRHRVRLCLTLRRIVLPPSSLLPSQMPQSDRTDCCLWEIQISIERFIINLWRKVLSAFGIRSHVKIKPT